MPTNVALQLLRVDEVRTDGRREWAGYGAVARLQHEDGFGFGARLIHYDDGVKG